MPVEGSELVHLLAVVGEVDQGGGCVLTLDAGDECGEEVVVVADGIVVLVDGGAGLGREVRLGVGQRVVEAREEVEVGGVAVFIPDVTAHEVKHDQFRAIAGGGQGLLEGRQEDAVGGLAGGEVDGVIGQLQEGVVAGRAVEQGLIADDVRLESGTVEELDERGVGGEAFGVVPVGEGERGAEHGDGVHLWRDYIGID